MWRNHGASIKGDPVNPVLVKTRHSKKKKRRRLRVCVECVRRKTAGLYRDLIREK